MLKGHTSWEGTFRGGNLLAKEANAPRKVGHIFWVGTFQSKSSPGKSHISWEVPSRMLVFVSKVVG